MAHLLGLRVANLFKIAVNVPEIGEVDAVAVFEASVTEVSNDATQVRILFDDGAEDFVSVR